MIETDEYIGKSTIYSKLNSVRFKKTYEKILSKKFAHQEKIFLNITSNGSDGFESHFFFNCFWRIHLQLRP